MEDVERLFKKGLEALSSGDTLFALSCFEKVLSIENNTHVQSYYAYCIAKERGLIKKAISLCEEAIKKEPDNSSHYLNLGRTHLLSKNREEAVATFRQGLKYGVNQEITAELDRLGTRKPPVIPFLKRSNPLNKYLGILLKKVGLR